MQDGYLKWKRKFQPKTEDLNIIKVRTSLFVPVCMVSKCCLSMFSLDSDDLTHRGLYMVEDSQRRIVHLNHGNY